MLKREATRAQRLQAALRRCLQYEPASCALASSWLSGEGLAFQDSVGIQGSIAGFERRAR
jgi:hypothetical protein